MYVYTFLEDLGINDPLKNRITKHLISLSVLKITQYYLIICYEAERLYEHLLFADIILSIPITAILVISLVAQMLK